jgi:hypothetical protein
MNEKVLQKIEQFVKLAVSSVRELENQVSDLQKKASVQMQKKAALSVSLEKAASALYESDFLTDDFEKRDFLKRASEDPAYLAEMLTKVCKAADVSSIGDVARVATQNTEDEEDPVMVRAFGRGFGRGDLLDQD